MKGLGRRGGINCDVLGMLMGESGSLHVPLYPHAQKAEAGMALSLLGKTIPARLPSFPSFPASLLPLFFTRDFFFFRSLQKGKTQSCMADSQTDKGPRGIPQNGYTQKPRKPYRHTQSNPRTPHPARLNTALDRRAKMWDTQGATGGVCPPMICRQSHERKAT